MTLQELREKFLEKHDSDAIDMTKTVEYIIWLEQEYMILQEENEINSIRIRGLINEICMLKLKYE